MEKRTKSELEEHVRLLINYREAYLETEAMRIYLSTEDEKMQLKCLEFLYKIR